LPEEGVHGRWPSTPLEQERILNKYRIYAARHFARVNQLNKVMIDNENARLGIITTGKAYLDVMQALEDLGIDAKHAAEIGFRVFKVGMPWPLEPVSTHEFARGLDEILVVEEKRSIIEDQLTGQLYNWPTAERPRVFGEFDEEGRDLLTNLGELTPAMVARAIASRIAKFYDSKIIHERLAFLEAKEQMLAKPRHKLDRAPHYCSGCPHNTSTRVPEGSRAMAGIGCHYMVTWMDRRTDTFTQMGGEGATWIGQAPFTDTKHVFQNMGDGTYFHSGYLAIRAANAAGVNITYKILFNDAVAMTGGQPIDGQLSVEKIIYQLRGEGIKRIAVVTDQPDKYPATFPAFDGLTIDHRDRFDAIQKELREMPGTTIIIYDQTCAAEKRRRRKKGLLEDPPVRVFINEDVCEGCGDCSVQSNCLSVLPTETELGRKRRIDQNACNKDYSCLKGFCPSFVTVLGGELRKNKKVEKIDPHLNLPEPALPAITRPWNVLVTGIGGTGVLTISAILAMAAHIEGKGCSTLNQTGLAQKFGAVVSHVRIGQRQEEIYAVRIAAGDADLMLGCDLVVSDSNDALAKLHRDRSYAVINEYESITSAFIRDGDATFPTQAMKQTIMTEVGEEKASFIDATKIATALLGDSIGSNLFLLGYAFQKGLIPVSADAIEQAIALNNVAVLFNQHAFEWGRHAAHDLDRVLELANVDARRHKFLIDLDEVVAWRKNFLTDYQDSEYAAQYQQFVDEIRGFEQQHFSANDNRLTEAVARNLFKLMAYKDEYEVARLYTNGNFAKKLGEQFEGDFKLKFHLAPPLMAKKDITTGHLIKRTFPGFTMKVFKVLAKLKGLRGSRWDLFGYSQERRQERELIKQYQQTIRQLLEDISTENYEVAVEIAALPGLVRGFGHVKQRNVDKVKLQQDILLDQFYGRAEKVVRIRAQQVA
ncbi:MAG: indolepyruvate ferredoxin oxidoreductase family protein, partial [Pseudomonadales bacterium]|nr:indolepyruvate ferredoxin oxidoreductase family protein [Pseudomonadales bacterium]